MNDTTPPFGERLRKLNWEKLLIWAAFLVLLYSMRQLFFVAFFTFVFCYVIRSVVVAIRKSLFGDRQSLWLDRGITLGVLATAAVALIATAAIVFPIVMKEFRVLSAVVEETQPSDVENAILQGTVGSFLFNKQYGDSTDKRFQSGLDQWKSEGRQGTSLYRNFPKLDTRLKQEFEAQYNAKLVHHLRDDFDSADETKQFREWFLLVKTPKLFAKRTDYYSSIWQAQHGKLGSTEIPNQDDKDSQIRELIFQDVRSDSVALGQLRQEWESYATTSKLAAFRGSKQYQQDFKQFYENRRRENEAAVPFDYDLFEQLQAAYGKGKAEFLTVVNKNQKANDSPQYLEHEFKVATQQELAHDWWASSTAASTIREHIQKDSPAVLERIGSWLSNMISSVSSVPIQLFVSFLLALLILMDIGSLAKGVQNLQNTRLRPVYNEVVPVITTLGKLLGKSFRGQAIIALIDATFMLLVMLGLGIENRFLFAGLVFVFSFVPVVGVVISGIPIILTAIMQPGGSLTLALYVIAAIAIAHTIEGTILSPKILGKLGQMHPVIVMVTLTIAEHFFGMWGLLLGVPVAIYLIRVVLLGKGILGITTDEALTT